MNKKFRFGGYAALATFIVIALVIVLNLLVDRIPATLDLTGEKLFTLAPQTEKILESLQEDINIYGLFEAGKEPDFVDEILKKYARASRKIRLKYVDPYRNPGLLERYKTGDKEPGAGSLILAADKRFEVLNQAELFTYSKPPGNDPFGMHTAQSMKAEERLTGAILLLTGQKRPTVYVLQGHLEESLPFELKQRLEDDNYKVKSLNLLTEGSVPADADVLLVLSPGTDLAAQETREIRDFLINRRKHAFFTLDIVAKDLVRTNLDSLLRGFGVTIQRVLIFEGDPQYHIPQLPIGLVPEIKLHSITADLIVADLAVLFPQAQAITQPEVMRRSVDVEPLLLTSDKAWGKLDLENLTFEPLPEDTAGPFTLAAAITDAGQTNQDEVRIVVTGSSFFLYPEKAVGVPLQGPGNLDFMLNAISWLYGKEALISIRPKSLTRLPLRLTQQQFFLFSGISVILIPLLIFGAALGLWLRRRHR